MALPPNNLRRLRRHRGLKVHELAVEIGCHPATVARWEAGAVIPDEKKFILAEYFGVKPGFLAGWEPSDGGEGEVEAAA